MQMKPEKLPDEQPLTNGHLNENSKSTGSLWSQGSAWLSILVIYGTIVICLFNLGNFKVLKSTLEIMFMILAVSFAFYKGRLQIGISIGFAILAAILYFFS